MTDPATADAERLSNVYSAYGQDLLRYATRRVGAVDAPDIVATVFAIAWRKIDQMPDDALPWLYRIAGFEVLKVGRRRANARRLASALAVESAHVTVGDHELLIDALWVEQVINSLRAADAELLRLVVWEDLDVPRAAAVLGCSATAAHVRLHRLRKRVEARLRALTAEDRRREGGTR
ncbi:MAG: RNA polymerase sigma factor [Acidothermaceae bacterium]